MSRPRKAITYKINVNGCHICTSHFLNGGYPRIQRNGKSKYLSRIIYEKMHGLIPKGMEIRHICDTPACINPEHLIIGTHFDNMRDCVERGRTRNGREKLIESQVREIRNSKLLQKELSKIYNISISQISYIKNKLTWKHVN